MTPPTRAEIIEAAYKTSPVLHSVLQMWRSGEWTWDECMSFAALRLARDNESLMRRMVDIEMNRPVRILKLETP